MGLLVQDSGLFPKGAFGCDCDHWASRIFEDIGERFGGVGFDYIVVLGNPRRQRADLQFDLWAQCVEFKGGRVSDIDDLWLRLRN